MRRVCNSTRSILIAVLLCGAAVGQTLSLNSYAQMPADSTLLLFNYGQTWPPETALALEGIAVTPDNGWSGWSGAFFSDPTSTIAPSGSLVSFTEFRLDFTRPTYSVGATFIVTPGTSDPNLPDVVYRVQAFDHNANILGAAYSSSSVQRNGPVAFHVGAGSVSFVFMASFAGLWSDTPIAYATFTLAQPTPDLGHRACISALAFSNNPLNTYNALVQPPIRSDGSAVFSSRRGVLPVKFTLTRNGSPTCMLPSATVVVNRISDTAVAAIAESVYSTSSNIGSSFRIDPSNCQYIYNIAIPSLGPGSYRVDIKIDEVVVGNAVFTLQ